MTREQTKSLMPVLLAWSRGETVQASISGEEWEDQIGDDMPFDNKDLKWKVKPTNLLPGLHEAMRLLKQNDLDYGPGRILERIKELGGSVDEQKAELRDFWLVGGRSFLDKFIAEHSNHNNDPIIHCREVVE